VEAAIVIFLLFALGVTFNLVSRGLRRDRRRKEWEGLHQDANSDDPEVRRKAAEKAVRLLDG
jgi:hypothetical protein